MPSPATIDVSRTDGVCVLDIRGEVTLGQPTSLLREKSIELVDGGERSFVLNMVEVPWLDSSGIGEVVACYKRARQHGGVVKLVLRPKSHSLFTLTQLDRIFQIFDSVDRAVASFRATESPAEG